MVRRYPVIEFEFTTRKKFNSRKLGEEFFSIIDEYPEFEPDIMDFNDPPKRRYRKSSRLDDSRWMWNANGDNIMLVVLDHPSGPAALSPFARVVRRLGYIASRKKAARAYLSFWVRNDDERPAFS
ncbi:MAG: hypothetical protein AAF514_20145, partial [Verrucomicrobiota bacterium]